MKKLFLVFLIVVVSNLTVFAIDKSTVGLDVGYSNFLNSKETFLKNGDTFEDNLFIEGLKINLNAGYKIPVFGKDKIDFIMYFEKGLTIKHLYKINQDMDPDDGSTFAFSENNEYYGLLGLDKFTNTKIGFEAFAGLLGVGNDYFLITCGPFGTISYELKKAEGIVGIRSKTDSSYNLFDYELTSKGLSIDIGLKLKASVYIKHTLGFSFFAEFGNSLLDWAKTEVSLENYTQKDTSSSFWKHTQYSIGGGLVLVLDD